MTDRTPETCCAPAGTNAPTNLEDAVIDRYASGAAQREAALCCPTTYDPKHLAILPAEIIERDYGCGDPSAHVHEGETVVDLGSGGGKVCYILSQKVGPSGRVIGVDFNDTMLALARKYEDELAAKIGHANVAFRKGKIQDLALDLDRAQAWLDANPIRSVGDVSAYETECERLRATEPMIPTGSVDVVVSNCVLNLVRPGDKARLFDEIFRVLKRGGRAVISDIVSDEESTARAKADPELWSGCISGAFVESAFLEAFENAGFYGIEILERQAEPWRVVDGVEYRSITVRAFKGKEGECREHGQALIYRGPWKCVCDDDGHTYYRGKRMAVCKKTFDLLTSRAGPYADDIVGIEPREPIAEEDAALFDCSRDRLRDPRETKGRQYDETTDAPAGGCC